MTTLNRLLQPGRPEAAYSHLAENSFMGGLPGRITAVDDPEKIGRVRVRCPLIDPHNDLPNNQGGWIPFLERRTLNAAAGGEHTLLEPGTDVILLPIGGDLTNVVILGCIPNREDPPHPETDRSKGTHGSVTSGQVFDLKNDTEASHLQMWPTGVIKSVSASGDITHQTRDGARSQLTADGTARIENQHAFSVVQKDGTVSQKSKDGAILNLHGDGTADITSAGKASLVLDTLQAKLGGPMHEIAALFQQGAKQLQGVLATAQKLTKQFDSIRGGLQPGQAQDATQTVMDKAQKLFQRLSGQIQKIPDAITALGKLQDKPPADLAQMLSYQIDLAVNSNLGAVTKQVETILKAPEVTTTVALLNTITDVLPAEWLGKNSEELTQILDSLRQNDSSVAVQIRAVLDNYFPGGTDQLSGVIDLDLHRVFDDLQGLTATGMQVYQEWVEARAKLNFFIASEPDLLPDSVLSANEASTRRTLDDSIQTIRRLLPSSVQQLLGADVASDAIEVALGQPDAIAAITNLMGATASNGIKQAVTHLEGALAGQAAVQPMNDFFVAVKQGDAGAVQGALGSLSQVPGLPDDFGFDGKDIEGWLNAQGMKLLDQTLGSLSDQLKPLLTDGLDKIAKLSNLVPPDTAKAVVRALPSVVEAYTGLGGAGGRMQIMEAAAELVGPFSKNRVFAGAASAGIKTPHGTFGLGGDGASIFAQGAMLLRAANLGRNIAHGISLSPQGAALSAFFDATGWDNPLDAPSASATIGAVGNTVTMQSFSPNGSIRHGITVSPDGIFLDDFEISYLSTLGARFSVLEARLLALESFNAATP